jgi:hypothetical protein
MADPLDIFRQRERPGHFVQPTMPPRDIRDLSVAELDSYLRGFSSPPVGNDPTASPYSAQDLRLERARRGTPTRRMDEGFEDVRISNPPPTMRARPAAARPSNTATSTQSPATPRPGTTNQSEIPPPPPDPAQFLNQQVQAQQPTQSSVLDMLRGRIARDTENEALQRASEFGAGMLASGSPNFFAMLGGGARAAREGDVSRMDQLRRLADLERQDAAQRAEETRRREELRIREEDLRVNAPYRAALTEQALATAAEIRSGRGRGTLTPAALAGIYQRAQAQALRDFPDPAPGVPETNAEKTDRLNKRAQRAEQLIAGALATAGQTPAASSGAAPSVTSVPTPAAVIDARGNVVNPPR